MPSQTALKLEWLKSVRAAVAEAVQRMEDGIHLLNGAGDEHMRDAAEAALERARAFHVKLTRRIAVEEGRLG